MHALLSTDLRGDRDLDLDEERDRDRFLSRTSYLFADGMLPMLTFRKGIDNCVQT